MHMLCTDHLFGDAMDKVMAVEQAGSPHGVVMSAAFYAFMTQAESHHGQRATAPHALQHSSTSHDASTSHAAQSCQDRPEQHDRGSATVLNTEWLKMERESGESIDVRFNLSQYVPRPPQYESLLRTLDTIAAIPHTYKPAPFVSATERPSSAHTTNHPHPHPQGRPDQVEPSFAPTLQHATTLQHTHTLQHTSPHTALVDTAEKAVLDGHDTGPASQHTAAPQVLHVLSHEALHSSSREEEHSDMFPLYLATVAPLWPDCPLFE